MEKTKIGRQVVDGSDNIHIYHSRLLLSEKKLPIITRHQTEVANWIYLQKQDRIHQDHHRMTEQSGSNIDVMSTGSSSKEAHTLVQAIIDIPGVAFAIPAGYQIVVLKAQSFEWAEIEKHILLLMSSFNLDIEDMKFTEEPNASPATDKEAPSNL